MRLLTALALAAVAIAAAPQSAPPHNIDVQHSKMTVLVYKQGLFSFLADNHIVDIPIERGSLDAERKSVDLTIDAAQMRVLDPRLPADKRNTIQANMLGPQVLDVAKYPTITFQSTAIDEHGNGEWTVTGNLQLHGQTHSITLAVQSGVSGHFTGSAKLRQTAFGIAPIKIAGGAVSVRDEVRVEFDIACCS